MTGLATQAWQNIQTTLSQAGASLSDIVSVRQWLTSAEDVRAQEHGQRVHLLDSPAAANTSLQGKTQRGSADGCTTPLPGVVLSVVALI